MKPVFTLVSIVVVLLMFIVPFTILSTVEGPYTALFWVCLSGAYLAFVWFALRRQ